MSITEDPDYDGQGEPRHPPRLPPMEADPRADELTMLRRRLAEVERERDAWRERCWRKHQKLKGVRKAAREYRRAKFWSAFEESEIQKRNMQRYAEEVTRLKRERDVLKDALEHIRDYPPEGHERRTDDGYPAEIVYDEFAYRRIVDSYRESAARALGCEEGRDDG